MRPTHHYYKPNLPAFFARRKMFPLKLMPQQQVRSDSCAHRASQQLTFPDRSFLQSDLLTPQSAYSNYSDGQSSALGTPSTQVTTPSSMFSRKPAGGLLSRTPSPPSPNLASNLDSAFPYFPLKSEEDSRARERKPFYPSEEPMVPPSPRIDVMKRMNTVAPGPFGAQRSRLGEKSGPGMQSSQIQRNISGNSSSQIQRNISGNTSSQIQRNASGNSSTQIQRNVSGNSSTQAQFRNQEGREHLRKASNASSLKSQNSVRSDRSVDRMRALTREGTRDPPPVSRPRRPTDTVDRFLEALPSEGELLAPPMLSPELRSRTFPETQQSRFTPGSRNAVPPPSAPHNQSQFFPPRSQDDSERPTTSAGPSRGYGGFAPTADPAIQTTFKPQTTYNPYEYKQPAPEAPGAGRLRSKTVTRPSRPSGAPDREWFERPRASPIPPSEPFTPSIPPFSQSSGIPSVPSAAARNRSKTITRPPGPWEISQFDRRVEVAPPVPYVAPIVRQLSNGSQRSDIYHAPSDSNSSYASSNSTPPTSDGSSISRSGSSSNLGDKSEAFGAQRDPPSFIRTEVLAPPPAPSAGGFHSSPESPMDPAIQKGTFTDGPRLPMNRPEAGGFGQGSRLPMDTSPPRNRPEPPRFGGEPRLPVNTSPPRTRPQVGMFSNGTGLPVNVSPPRMRPEPFNMPRDMEPPAFRQPQSKGECRGCGTPIYGKSVKAADGRLSGRFHKECFSCKTCQAPFPTGEFYVLDDSPYCERHYHELNGSVCGRCDRGIEGPYLETDARDKYHTACFCCSKCPVRLREDYYEVDGQPVCEKHAFAMRPQQRGAPAPVFERRRTKLMMI
jgi:hypothetical protein